jgi:cytochrome P450
VHDRPGGELTRPLTDPNFHADDPFPLYARLREHAPLAWNDEVGFWAVSTHADVMRISGDPETFCSSRGILLMDIGRDLPEIPGALLYVDQPVHGRYRKLVNPGFSGARVRALEADIRTRARGLLDTVEAGVPFDVVEQLSVPFPMLVIADLLGIPGNDVARYQTWSDAAIAAATEMTVDTTVQLTEMAEFFLAVADARRRDPRDDLVSMLVHDPVDGERLNDGELLMFLGQLLVAGNETTRNLLSGGLVALAVHTDQWDRMRADRALIPTAVEELLRWTTPVISFMRTATRDVQLGEQVVREGEPVLLLYASANRDETVFGTTAERLDVGRAPNPHVAFGYGPHFCLGAALARLEARVFFEELLDRFSTLDRAGDVEWLASGVIHGVVRAPLVLT